MKSLRPAHASITEHGLLLLHLGEKAGTSIKPNSALRSLQSPSWDSPNFLGTMMNKGTGLLGEPTGTRPQAGPWA